MRILLFGDGRWATESLRALIDDAGHDLLGVVTRLKPTEPSLMELAGELNLPVHCPAKVNAPDFVKAVSDMRPDINVSISYDQILREQIVKTAPLGFINFHAGKLPHYRGRNVVNWAIINGETEIGLTSHYIDEGIDTGDIILQESLPIEWTDTYHDVLQKLFSRFPGFVSETLRAIADGTVNRKRQRDLPGTYFPARGEGDEWIDWNDTSLTIYNKIRAITRPGPGARTVYNGRNAIIWRSSYDRGWPAYIATPGRIINRVKGEGVFVKTGDSVLLLEEVQIDHGEPKIPDWPVGTQLGIDIGARLRELETRISMIERSIAQSRKPES
jgi:methionyl-tRNA formyltransferase